MAMDVSLLIVDDDKYLVDRLEATLQWEKIGVSMVFTAYNIRQAVKLLEEFSIQLLLCDIDMPQGSGLELLEWIRKKQYRLDCVFLSSYANFAYAQKALSLATREYLLKPISNQELEAVLARIVQEYAKRGAKETADRPLPANADFWERFFRAEAGYEELLESAAAAGRFCREDTLLFAGIRVCADPGTKDNRKELSLLHRKISNLSEEFFGRHNIRYEGLTRIRETGWAFVIRPAPDLPNTEELLKEWKNSLDKALSQKVFVYIGQPRPLPQAVESYEILEEMEKCLLPGENGFLTERDLPEGNTAEYVPLQWEIWQKLLETPEDLEYACGVLLQYLAERFEQKGLTLENLERFLKEFEHFIYGRLGSSPANFHKLFDSSEYIRKEKLAHISLDGTCAFVRWVFGRLEGGACAQDQRDVVDQIKDYIEKHLDGELSRSLLAKEVFLSEDYLSKLFKSTTGVSLPSYIAARRIERAKEYLVCPAIPVSRIALEVGYNNFSYFSKTFRDITGMTPNEYRSQKEKK